MSIFRREGVGQAAKEIARAHGERAMASASALDGTLLVATDRAIHVGDVRLPWDRVAKASWEDEVGVLTVVGSTGATEPARTLVLEVAEATRLLEVVRTMVTASVVVSQRIESRVFGGAWVTARREPDAVELRWTVVFDPGNDPRDPERRAWADENVAEIRRSTGV